MSTELPLTIKQHLYVREALFVVDEEARYVASLYHVKEKDHRLDDWKSVGKLALYDAVRRFDPNKDGKPRKFSTFARFRVRGEILDTVKAERHVDRIELAMARAVAFRMAEYADDFDVLRHDDEELQRRRDLFCDSAAAVMFAAGVQQAIEETAQDPQARAEYARAVTVLQDLVKALNPEERSLLDMLFGLRWDLQKAADELHIHKSMAWRKLQRLLESLRRELHTRYVRERPLPVNDVELPSIFPEPDDD